MALQISDLQVRLSGGTVNVNPVASLGGQMSSEEVLSQTTTAPSNVTGVDINNAYGNALGAGTLKWYYDTNKITWEPNGAAVASSVDILTNTGSTPTVYVVGGSTGYLVLTVVYSDLPGSTQSDSDITVGNYIHNVFDAVNVSQATAGLIEYRCLYIINTHSADTAYDVRIWVKEQPIGPDHIDLALQIPVEPSIYGQSGGVADGIALGPLQAGASGTAEEDGTDILSTAQGASELQTWTRPTTQETGLLLDQLAPGEAVCFWEMRTVDAETQEQVSNDTSKIGISALI